MDDKTVEELQEILWHDAPVPYGFCWCGCGQVTNTYKRTKIRYGKIFAVKGIHKRYIQYHKKTPRNW